MKVLLNKQKVPWPAAWQWNIKGYESKKMCLKVGSLAGCCRALYGDFRYSRKAYQSWGWSLPDTTKLWGDSWSLLDTMKLHGVWEGPTATEASASLKVGLFQTPWSFSKSGSFLDTIKGLSVVITQNIKEILNHIGPAKTDSPEGLFIHSGSCQRYEWQSYNAR